MTLAQKTRRDSFHSPAQFSNNPPAIGDSKTLRPQGEPPSATAVGCRIQHPSVHVDGQAKNDDLRQAARGRLPRRVTALAYEDAEIGGHEYVSRVPVDGNA